VLFGPNYLLNGSVRYIFAWGRRGKITETLKCAVIRECLEIVGLSRLLVYKIPDALSNEISS
jgi:hypothetical protein